MLANITQLTQRTADKSLSVKTESLTIRRGMQAGEMFPEAMSDHDYVPRDTECPKLHD
jgi:hypothetical protein